MLPNDKDTHLPLKLYFMHYQLKIGTRLNVRDKYIPIIMVPLDNVEINNLGCFSRYVHVGAYICKVLEYKCLLSEKEKKATSCSSQYLYYGLAFDNIFPFNEIQIIKDQDDKLETNMFKEVIGT